MRVLFYLLFVLTTCPLAALVAPPPPPTVTVTYADELRSAADDALFELVAAHGSLNGVSFTLRARAPGRAEATISATGEVRSPEGAFSWGGGASPPLTLIVTAAAAG